MDMGNPSHLVEKNDVSKKFSAGRRRSIEKALKKRQSMDCDDGNDFPTGFSTI